MEMVYESKAPQELEVRKMGRYHYRVIAIKDLNNLKPYEIANDINYCFQDEKMNFQKIIEDYTMLLFSKFGFNISDRNSEEQIECAFKGLLEKGKRIVIKDLNPDRLVCDENNIITMHCDIYVEKV